MYRRKNAFHYLLQNIEYIDPGYLQLDQYLEKLNRVKGICRREHEPRIQAILSQELTDAILIPYLVKVLPQIVFQERPDLFIYCLRLFLLILELSLSLFEPFYFSSDLVFP